MANERPKYQGPENAGPKNIGTSNYYKPLIGNDIRYGLSSSVASFPMASSYRDHSHNCAFFNFDFSYTYSFEAVDKISRTSHNSSAIAEPFVYALISIEFDLVYNKSTTNRTNGVGAYALLSGGNDYYATVRPSVCPVFFER